jgi:hypothetical protein
VIGGRATGDLPGKIKKQVPEVLCW